jgi:hypothetical protein
MSRRSDSSNKSDCSTWLFRHSQAGLILILSTSTPPWRKRRLSIAEEMNPYSVARRSSNCYYNSLLFFLHQFHEFGSSSGQVVQSTTAYVVRKSATKKLKNAPVEIRTQHKKASETLQPERVPWAKMATVNIPLIRGRISLPLNIA